MSEEQKDLDSNKYVMKIQNECIIETEHFCRFDFSGALILLRLRKRVRRKGWNGKNMFLEIQEPVDNNLMTLPYIYIFTADRQYVPWVASQTDLLSSDWEVVE